MLKWLQNRQLGHTVNKKTIRDQLAIHLWPKFKYRGVINDPNDDEMRDAYIRGLDWTSDGHYLISLDKGDNYDKITIWENPNIYAEQRVKSKIKLIEPVVNNNDYLTSMHCHGSNLVLGGAYQDGFNDHGVIYLITLSTGQQKHCIRNWFLTKKLN